MQATKLDTGKAYTATDFWDDAILTSGKQAGEYPVLLKLHFIKRGSIIIIF